MTIENKLPEITGDSRLDVLEENDVAFNPTNQHLDLTKSEKRRTTSLLMAIQAYQHMIIRDADYLAEAARQSRDNPDFKIKSATMDAIVEAAIQFDMFIAGKFKQMQNKVQEDCENDDND